MEKEFVSVKEAAALLQITPQAIYKKLKRLNNENNQIVNDLQTVENGRKLVNISLLADLFNISLETVEQQLNNGDKQFNNQEQTDIDGEITREYINSLKQQIESLERQNTELTRLLDQQQQLTLATEQRLLLLEQETEQPEQAAENKEAERGFFSRFFRA